MKNQYVATALAIAVGLAGCATPAEQAQRMTREMDRMMEVYGPACEKLGFQRETDPWRNCVIRLSERDRFGQYGSYPMTSSCFGPPGFIHCAPF